jgi:hypothetical protein
LLALLAGKMPTKETFARPLLLVDAMMETNMKVISASLSARTVTMVSVPYAGRTAHHP